MYCTCSSYNYNWGQYGVDCAEQGKPENQEKTSGGTGAHTSEY